MSPEDVKKVVEYHPEWRTELRFFVDEERWHVVRPWLEALRASAWPQISWAPLGHTTEDRDGVRFGSEDRECEAAVARVLGLESPAPPPRTEARRRGRTPAYPFEELDRVGAHFLVRDKSKLGSLSTTCRHWETSRPGRLYRTATVEDGVVVVMVQHESSGYEREV